MKILFTVEYFYPRIGGAQEVIRQIAVRLARKGHQITVATSYIPERRSEELNGVKIVSFNIKGNKARGIYGETNQYKEFLVSSDFDIICNYAAQSWTTDLTFDVLGIIKAKKVLIPCGYSGLALWSKRFFYWYYFRKLPIYLQKYDHIIYHSENYIDKVFGDKHGVKNFSIIPNGIDLEEMQAHNVKFRECYEIKTKYMLLNVSNHYKLKGHSFILKAFNSLKIEDVTLVIVGNRISGIRGCYNGCKHIASKNQQVILLDSIPREHIISAYNEADIFVFGSKVECFPLVILEAMSVGLPFISTDVGCVKNEMVGGVIVSSPDEMALSINKLLNNNEYRNILGSEGKRQCLKYFIWDDIVNKYENLFYQLIDKEHE